MTNDEALRLIELRGLEMHYYPGGYTPCYVVDLRAPSGMLLAAGWGETIPEALGIVARNVVDRVWPPDLLAMEDHPDRVQWIVDAFLCDMDEVSQDRNVGHE